MRSYISLAALLATTVFCPAQVLHPEVKDRATDGPGNTRGAPSDNTTTSSSQQEKGNSSPYGNELPFFDPAGEPNSWNGLTWAATDNRLLAARF